MASSSDAAVASLRSRRTSAALVVLAEVRHMLVALRKGHAGSAWWRTPRRRIPRRRTQASTDGADEDSNNSGGVKRVGSAGNIAPSAAASTDVATPRAASPPARPFQTAAPGTSDPALATAASTPLAAGAVPLVRTSSMTSTGASSVASSSTGAASGAGGSAAALAGNNSNFHVAISSRRAGTALAAVAEDLETLRRHVGEFLGT